MTDQRGSILIFSVLILATVLGISLALANVFAPRLRVVSEASSSTVAVYAADSASEMCLYEARKETNDTGNLNGGTLANGATFTIRNIANGQLVTSNCSVLGSGSMGFEAVGSYMGIYRAFEVQQ